MDQNLQAKLSQKFKNFKSKGNALIYEDCVYRYIFLPATVVTVGIS